MNKYKHLKEKAQKFREDGKSIDDICKHLNKSKSTVWYWIKDVKINKPAVFLKNWKERNGLAQRKAALAVRKKFNLLHEEAKEQAEKEWKKLSKDKSFLLFIMAYWCEGTKKGKHYIDISNSDPKMISFVLFWMKKINYRKRPLIFRVQVHVDQDEKEIVNYWKKVVSSNDVKIMRKSNSGKMSGRKWNSKYGVLSIRISDAYLKTKMDCWIDKFKETI